MTTLPPLIIYPASLPLVVLQNSTFRRRFVVKRGGVAVDISDVSTIIDADIKDSSGIRIGTFTTVKLTSDGSPVAGAFDIELTPAQSLALPIATNHKYDLSITIDGDRFYYVEGPLEVRKTQSRNSQ